MSIFIFSKPIRSGKTTELLAWCKAKENCAGILMPDVDGVRKMYDIKACILFEAECKGQSISNKEMLTIGHYSFFKEAFNKANFIIETALILQPKWLIIDEVGKLELDKKGFYPSVSLAVECLKKCEFKGNLLLVVRESLLSNVTLLFNLKQFKVIDNCDKMF